MPKEIEPDGQQFLDARGADEGDSEPLGETEPVEVGRSIALPVAIVIGVLVVIAGVVAIFVLGSGDGVRELTDLATGGNVEVSERGGVERATTTEAADTTTSAPPTTEAPTTLAPTTVTTAVQPTPTVIVPGQPGPVVIPQSSPSCPGGSVATGVTSQLVRRESPGSNVWIMTASGTATSYFPAAINLNLELVLSSGPNKAVSVSPNPIPPNGTANWTFEGRVPAGDVLITNLVGTFSLADPAYSNCQSGSLG